MYFHTRAENSNAEATWVASMVGALDLLLRRARGHRIVHPTHSSNVSFNGFQTGVVDTNTAVT